VKVATGYYDPGQQITLIPITLAGALLFTLPPLLAFFLLQKKLARGIVTTGLKG
jgi:ABC-type glycerol-3-phosphate transport system permease component